MIKMGKYAIGAGLRTLIVCLFFVCLAVLPVIASQISITSKKEVIKTAHFDFIYSIESKASAQALVAVAEDYYTEITQKLFVPDMDLHIPVVITPESDGFNGYFTPFPYNRIVMYDTVASAGSLQVFSDTLCSVFYHELTHAVSLNIRSSFWSGMATVFGDIITPAMFLNCTTSFTEGVTVSFESAHGEGRLNNSFSTQIVKQAKIEGSFPSLYDITGARDTYPSGNLPYIFGGCFSRYLQQTYGMQKYAEFWEQCGRLHLYKIDNGILKEVYDKSGSDLWDEFYESIPVPDNVKLPQVATNLENAPERSFPKNLCSAQTAECGPVFVWQDGATGNIYGALKKTPVSNYSVQKISCNVLSERMAISKDAKYFTISGFTRENKLQNVTQIYALSGFASKLQAKDIGITIPHLRDAAIISDPNVQKIISESTDIVLYITGVETLSQNSSLVVYKVNVATKKIEKIGSLDFAPNQVPFTPYDASNGKIIYLLKDALDWKIALYDLPFKESITFNTGLDVQEMSVSGDTVLLSCATKVANDSDSYPFYASMSLNAIFTACEQIDVLGFCGDTAKDPLWTGQTEEAGVAKLTLFQQPFSGAVYEPVLCGDDDIFYVSHFYDNWQLSILSKKEQITRTDTMSQKVLKNVAFTPNKAVDFTAMEIPTAQAYNPLPYMTKGVFIPFAGFNLTPLTYMSLATCANSRLGISWITADPTEQATILMGIGYDVFTNSVMANISAKATNTYTGYSFDGLIETTDNSFSGAAVQLDFNYTKPLGYSPFYYVLNNSAEWFFKNNVAPDTSIVNDNTFFSKMGHLLANNSSGVVGHYLNNYTQTGILWQKNTGVSPFQYLIFSAGIQSTEQYVTSEYGWYKGAYSSVHLPQLLPFSNTKNMTFNLPTTAGFSYYFASDMLCALQSTVVLFSTEIQKGGAIFPFYTRRVTLDGGYDQTFYTDSANNIICVHLSTALTQTFNVGAFCSNGYDILFQLKYYPLEVDEDSKMAFSINIGFDY